MDPTLILLIAGLAGFYMAWNIGANDVANSMGTSVGSGILTVRKAIYLAAILNILGAVLVGGNVTDTISKGIIDPSAFELNPELFMYGMLASVLAASLWITFATHLGFPVSTTHAVIGAITGFGIISAGVSIIDTHKLVTIFLSWILSPVAGALIAFSLFTLIKKFILNSENPFYAAKRYFPYTVALVTVTLSASICLKAAHRELNGETLLIIGVVGFVSASLSWILVRLYGKKEGRHYSSVEQLFGYLQILSACAMAFAQGSNDVANAVGPIAAIFHVAGQLSNGITTGIIQQTINVPLWLLAFGGLGIALGISTWGYKVMNTIGQRITEVTPTRGFAAEFGTATTVLVCSSMGLPISTSHTVVGAVIGVGFARGISALNFNIIKNIVFCWVVTIPIAAVLTMIVYSGIIYAL